MLEVGWVGALPNLARSNEREETANGLTLTFVSGWPQRHRLWALFWTKAPVVSRFATTGEALRDRRPQPLRSSYR
jgi:hypothetical protein